MRLVPTAQLAGITTKALLELQSSPLQEPRTQEDALSEPMIRLTVVPHQVLQLLQYLQHRKNQHRHLVLPFLCQAKVIRTVLQMDPLHAPSPVSLQQPQHRLRFPTSTLGLMVATLQETQEAPKPVHFQAMGVDKPVRDPTQMAVVTLLKRHLDHTSLRLQLGLHHLPYLPMFQGAALEMQRVLLVLFPAQTDPIQELVALLLSRHHQVLLPPATLPHLRQMLDRRLRKEEQILRPMETVPPVMEVLAHALVAHQPQKTVLSLIARSPLQTARYIPVLVVMAVGDLIRHKKAMAVVTVCLHATATARRALVVVNHLTLEL